MWEKWGQGSWQNQASVAPIPLFLEEHWHDWQGPIISTELLPSVSTQGRSTPVLPPMTICVIWVWLWVSHWSHPWQSQFWADAKCGRVDTTGQGWCPISPVWPVSWVRLGRTLCGKSWSGWWDYKHQWIEHSISEKWGTRNIILVRSCKLNYVT